MKKDYSILTIALSTVFCACSIGINVIYWKHFPALYLAGIVVGSIAFAISIACLLFRLIKKDKEERYYKILTSISMISSAIALCVPCIGTLIIMFI